MPPPVFVFDFAKGYGGQVVFDYPVSLFNFAVVNASAIDRANGETSPIGGEVFAALRKAGNSRSWLVTCDSWLVTRY